MVTDKPDSPHRMPPKIRCESYFACAEIDKWAPPADVEKLQAALREAGTPHRLEWYPGVEHGFVFPLRPHAYDRAAAERHWERLFEPVRAHAARAGLMAATLERLGQRRRRRPAVGARPRAFSPSASASPRRRSAPRARRRWQAVGGQPPAGGDRVPAPTRRSASTMPSARACPTGSRCAAAASAGSPTASPCRHRMPRPSPRSRRRSGSARSSFPTAAAPASSATCACPRATGRWSTSRSSGWRRCRRSTTRT